MTKRIIALILCAVLLLGIVFMGVTYASATEVANVTVTAEAMQATEPGKMVTSAECIRILKLEEGFSRTPYWDYAQWTVGYGTACPADKLEEYKANGISEAEAEALLRTHLTKYESEIHKLVDKTGLVLTQNQFDALVMFTYNCGSAWTYQTDGVLYKAVVGCATGNELINAFSRWCYAGGSVKTFLLRRRLCEANMYLNGVYSQKAPDNFAYALFDAAGGECSPNVQGYDTSLTATIIPVPTYKGYSFDGWYTARTGGAKVNVLDASTKNARLYAHWKDAQGNDPALDDSNGVKVTVTANDVNVRKGPGTNYDIVSKANSGDQLVITETATGTGYTWGKFASGWICLDYTTYETETKPDTEEKPSTETTGMGTVKVSDVLRIRSGPSTAYSVVGHLNNGDRVKILEQKIAGHMIWGKIDKGWISMDYVVMDKSESTQPPATEPPATEPPTTEPPATEQVKPEVPSNDTTVVTGTVNVKDFLRIRTGPSTSSAVVGYLSPNEKVTITERTTSGSMIWGKMSKGWVSMDYITLDKTAESTPAQKLTGTVKVSDFLRVRSGPGTSYAIAGYLSPNEKVTITEKRQVGNTTWGKISSGWVSMDYIVLDSGSQSSGSANAGQTTKTVTADCLRVRSAAGTGNKVVGYLYTGAKVTILETTKVDGVTWGKISTGWISMDYVK